MMQTILQLLGIPTRRVSELSDQVLLILCIPVVDERLGLIRARIMGGNAASGDFIVFLDAHCRVSPTWLETPYKLLVEVSVILYLQSRTLEPL